MSSSSFRIVSSSCKQHLGISSIRSPQHEAVLRIALTCQLQGGACGLHHGTERTRLMRWTRVRRDSREAFTDLTVSSSCLETCTPNQNVGLRHRPAVRSCGLRLPTMPRAC